MIYYLAGSPSPLHLEREANRADANHFLFTFAQSGARQCAKYFCVQPQRRLFIDSGAFTLWNSGGEVDLGEYITFCKQIKSMAKCELVFAALDVIPGSKGGPKPTDAEIARACDQGWDNYCTMKQEGIPCLMTYHQLEHKRWLKRIADDNDYLAVAPRKRGVTNAQKHEFLENVFGYIHGKERTPSKRIHGLGVSSTLWMKEFPFYSVDNRAWLQCFQSHSRGVLADNGFRTELWTLEDFQKHEKAGQHTADRLRDMLGYGREGESADLDGSSGYYYLMFINMACAVETECLITEHWRSQGVVWDGHKYLWDAVLRDCLSLRNVLGR
jgi:hypothetical protein